MFRGGYTQSLKFKKGSSKTLQNLPRKNITKVYQKELTSKEPRVQMHIPRYRHSALARVHGQYDITLDEFRSIRFYEFPGRKVGFLLPCWSTRDMCGILVYNLAAYKPRHCKACQYTVFNIYIYIQTCTYIYIYIYIRTIYTQSRAQIMCSAIG